MKRGPGETIASSKARPTRSHLLPCARAWGAGKSVSLLLVLCLPVVALAQSGGGYKLKKITIDGGGGKVTGGGYVLNVTVGQHDAGDPTGGGYVLSGGFWGATTSTTIPTVSEWGLVVLTLLLLAGAKIYFARPETVTA